MPTKPVDTRTPRTGRASMRLMGLAVVVVLCGFVAACGSSSTTSSSKTSTAAPAASGNAVTIKNFAFVPQTLTVKVGTTVTWTNDDTTPHDISFADKSIPLGYQINAGGPKKTYSHTFTTAGTFPYICGIHSYMMGTIKVTS